MDDKGALLLANAAGLIGNDAWNDTRPAEVEEALPVSRRLNLIGDTLRQIYG